jgi:hypothetical protein
MRRLELRYEVERNPETGEPFDARVSARADLSGFGRTVAARPPPASQVVSVAELAEALE